MNHIVPSNTSNPDQTDPDLSALFTTPQIHTDPNGRHRDDTGREHLAMHHDGELDYAPVSGPFPYSPLLSAEAARGLLAAAVAGLPLGDYDRRIIDWLGTMDASTVAVVAGLIQRARTAGGEGR